MINPTTTNFGRRPTEGGLEREETRVGVAVGGLLNSWDPQSVLLQWYMSVGTSLTRGFPQTPEAKTSLTSFRLLEQKLLFETESTAGAERKRRHTKSEWRSGDSIYICLQPAGQAFNHIRNFHPIIGLPNMK